MEHECQFDCIFNNSTVTYVRLLDRLDSIKYRYIQIYFWIRYVLSMVLSLIANVLAFYNGLGANCKDPGLFVRQNGNSLRRL